MCHEPEPEPEWLDDVHWDSEASQTDSTWGAAVQQTNADLGDDAGWVGMGSGTAADNWMSATSPPPPVRRGLPIETINVGIVQTPYKRRNGYHLEVAVQHDGADETIHWLWFGFEVLDDVAEIRGRDRYAVDVERFGEEVLTFVQQQGVDLLDPDWGLGDESIPFSTQYMPMRALFDYYPNLKEHLAGLCIREQEEVEELPKPFSREDLDVPLILDRPFIYDGEPEMTTAEQLQAAVDRGFQPSLHE